MNITSAAAVSTHAVSPVSTIIAPPPFTDLEVLSALGRAEGASPL